VHRLAALALATVPMAVFALVCDGCHQASAPPSPSGAPSATQAAQADAGETVVGVDDDGKSFDLAVGGALTFRLASRSGTGFEWVPAPLDGPALLQVGGRTIDVSSDVPGAPKMDVYRFVGHAAGVAVVEMSLERPWGGREHVKTVRVTVNVH
jgi:hypothetical protein